MGRPAAVAVGDHSPRGAFSAFGRQSAMQWRSDSDLTKAALQDCKHIQVVKAWYSWYFESRVDGQAMLAKDVGANDSGPASIPSTVVHFVANKPDTLILVHDDERIAVGCYWRGEEMLCTAGCGYRCVHTQRAALVEAEAGGSEDDEDSDVEADFKDVVETCIAVQLQRCLSRDGSSFAAESRSQDPIPSIFSSQRVHTHAHNVPDALEPGGVCACGCADWSVRKWSDATVFGSTWQRCVSLADAACGSCGARWQYDFTGNGLLDLDGRNIFTHELLDGYSVVLGGNGATTMSGFWNDTVNRYRANPGSGLPTDSTRDAAAKELVAKRGRFRAAWVSYVCLQNLDYASAFACTCTTEKHMHIIADGILLSARAAKAWVRSMPRAAGEPRAGSLHASRCFLPVKEHRQLCKTLIKEGLEPSAWRVLEAQTYEGLHAYTKLCVKQEHGKLVWRAQSHVTDFLKELVSESPACAVLPGRVHEDVQRALDSTPAMLDAIGLLSLKADAPIAARFILGESCGSGGAMLPECKILLREALQRARACYCPAEASLYSKQTRRLAATAAGENSLRVLEQAEARADITDYQEGSAGPSSRAHDQPVLTPEEEFLLTGAFFPTLQTYRRPIGEYYADYRNPARIKGPCTKFLYQAKGLTPGLFVVHCLRCAGCLGFQMMGNHESPKTLFEVLYSRWEHAPRVVVYDNACNAHSYFLNREPEWSKDTLFLVDKLHFKSHVGCCKSYNIDTYPELRNLNSSLAEQRNSRLATIKKPCAYMSQPRYLMFVRYFMYVGVQYIRNDERKKEETNRENNGDAISLRGGAGVQNAAA